jgi:hypothetical protein
LPFLANEAGKTPILKALFGVKCFCCRLKRLVYQALSMIANGSIKSHLRCIHFPYRKPIFPASSAYRTQIHARNIVDWTT